MPIVLRIIDTALTSYPSQRASDSVYSICNTSRITLLCCHVRHAVDAKFQAGFLATNCFTKTPGKMIDVEAVSLCPPATFAR